jgi:hypothetical protein
VKKRWQVLMVPATLVTALAALPSATSPNARVAPAADLQMVAEGPGTVVAFYGKHCLKLDPGNCIKCTGDCKPGQ